MEGAVVKRRVLSLDEHDKIEIDDDNRLYWDGELIVTTTKFSFPWWINLAAIATAFAVVGHFILAVVQFIWPPIT